MTVAIPEASSAAAASSARAPARMSRPTPAQMSRTGPPGPRGSAGPRGSQSRAVAAAPPGKGRPAVAAQRQPRPQGDGKKGKSRKKERGGDVARRLTGAATRPGSELHNYQAIVAAEFVAAILLVALTPIAARKATPSATSGKLSPYVPGDLIQLVAIGIVYLILEAVAAGPRGAARFAAWLGFLLLLGVGLFEASRLGELFKMLAGFNVGSIQLTGAQAPATKGETPIPPLAAGAPTPSTPKTGSA